jgi:hypothetical protein
MQTAGSESRIRFSIDSHNGAIILSDRLTSDDVNLTHRLLITAVDAGLPALSATTQLLIKVKTFLRLFRVKRVELLPQQSITYRNVTHLARLKNVTEHETQNSS